MELSATAVCAGRNGRIALLYYSSDGFTWTGVGTELTTLGFTGVASAAYSATEDRWVVCGNGTTNNAAYASVVSGTWTGLGSFFSGAPCRGVCTSNGAIANAAWLIVGSGLPNVYNAPSGGAGPYNTWAMPPFGSTNSSLSCAYGNGVFLIGGNGASTLVNSSDGTTFQSVAPEITSAVNAIVYSSDLGQWVATGGGTNSLSWSPMSGSSWTGVTGTSIFSNFGTGIAVIASSKKRQLMPKQFFIFIPDIQLAPPAIQNLLVQALNNKKRRG
jgi:hypothetical protein